MGVNQEQERVQALISEAVMVLCKKGLSYKSELSIEGLIGITLDKEKVFLVSVRETLRLDGNSKEDEDDSLDSSLSASKFTSSNSSRSYLRKKRRRKQTDRENAFSPTRHTNSENEHVFEPEEYSDGYEPPSKRSGSAGDVIDIKKEPVNDSDDDDVIEVGEEDPSDISSMPFGHAYELPSSSSYTALDDQDQTTLMGTSIGPGLGDLSSGFSNNMVRI